MKILISSRNKHKIEEIKNFFKDFKDIEFLSLEDISLDIQIEETGKTLLENALIKAKKVHEITGMPVISDDSGIFIEALGGFPGVHSAEFQKGNPDYLEKILELMKDKENRSAYFHCVIVFINNNGESHVFEGKVEGEIGFQIRGDKGFGYDPIFYYKPIGKTFGEIEMEVKNKISHRAIALKKLRDFLSLKFEDEGNKYF
ncbi:MAG: RdgB/HAM1 family non-canonical purine NTP pyrophosphatase [candidate division WOR-3 bacterium]|nr:RdgB/HAM1 family non-canonical purine NTP pyrophosphatase [candidate division WOR-3 bacterium]